MRYLGHRIREFCGSNDGTIWFGTEDKGLFHFNPADGTVTPFHHPALYHNIHGLCIDGDYLWAGTFAGGLNRIHLRTREVRHYEKGEASNTLNADNIFSIYKSSTGELWIGTTSGLMRYNRKTDDFTRIPEMNKIFVYNILEDCHGKLCWLPIPTACSATTCHKTNGNSTPETPIIRTLYPITSVYNNRKVYQIIIEK